jgi:hypothetical protein
MSLQTEMTFEKIKMKLKLNSTRDNNGLIKKFPYHVIL